MLNNLTKLSSLVAKLHTHSAATDYRANTRFEGMGYGMFECNVHAQLFVRKTNRSQLSRYFSFILIALNETAQNYIAFWQIATIECCLKTLTIKLLIYINKLQTVCNVMRNSVTAQ